MRNPLNRRRRLYAGCFMLVIGQTFGYAGQSPVTAGQEIGARTTRAVATGVIEGRVLDEAGRPVVWARVQPLNRLKYWNGPFYEAPVQTSDETDDRGRFRLHSLPAGSYFLAVTPPSRKQSLADTDVYLRTYYPGTAALGRAEPIVVRARAETALTVRLVRVPVVQVTGTIVDTDGEPLPNQNVTLSGRPLVADDGAEWHSEVHMPLAASAASEVDGTFALKGVAAGRYVLSAVNDRGRRQPGDSFTLAEMPIEVTNTPLHGLSVVLRPAATVRGRLEWAGDGPTPWPRDVSLGRIRLNPVGRSMDLGGLDTEVRPDGTFEFRALYGLRSIQSMGMNWAIDSLRGDAAVRDRWFLDVLPGTETPDLRIAVTNRAGWLFAAVLDETGKPFAREPGAFGGSVIVMPVLPTAPDTRYWGFYHASGIYSANGQTLAQIEHILPGRYLVAAIDVEPYLLSGDTELMERARAASTLVDAPSGRFDLRLHIVRLRAFIKQSIRIER